jgi:small subunit ribosomal protein S2
MHFGHQTRRWNPKMRRYILGERNGIYIIDLRKTLDGLSEAYAYVRDLVARGGVLLFVGTKKQTQGPVATYARACGMPYVNERWLGGMLTNFTTISSRVGKLREYEGMERAGDFDAMPKKEGLRHRRELEKLRRNLGGIGDLDRLPDAIFVIDTKKEHIAVTEANKLNMPVVAVVDTNCDPDVITYVIPGNDDAIRSGALMCRVMAEAVVEGRWIAEHRSTAPSGPAPAARAAHDVEVFPAISETTPAISETTPAISETTPATPQTTPATPQTAPATSETAPATSETAPSVAAESLPVAESSPAPEEQGVPEAIATPTPEAGSSAIGEGASEVVQPPRERPAATDLSVTTDLSATTDPSPATDLSLTADPTEES